MSRKTAMIEDFDDDTDLPLPSRPLSNTGRGPLLEEIGYSDDDDDDDSDHVVSPGLKAPTAGPASPSQPQFRPAQPEGRPTNTVTDITPYKKWTCIYPIYIDAKRPCSPGQRRIAREKSVWWPLSKDIADATNRLGLGTLHEVNKSHPRDWENPGRVRVQWKKDGRFVNSAIRSKKQLLEMVSFQIQRIKPDNVPKAPYITEPPRISTPTPSKAAAAGKGKQPASKSKTSTSTQTTQPVGGRRLPVPPPPLPPLATRVSPYSPALPSGVLIETVKAGMSAQETNAIPGAPGAGAQKGKRKVVRVRG